LLSNSYSCCQSIISEISIKISFSFKSSKHKLLSKSRSCCQSISLEISMILSVSFEYSQNQLLSNTSSCCQLRISEDALKLWYLSLKRLTLVAQNCILHSMGLPHHPLIACQSITLAPLYVWLLLSSDIEIMLLNHSSFVFHGRVTCDLIVLWRLTFVLLQCPYTLSGTMAWWTPLELIILMSTMISIINPNYLELSANLRFGHVFNQNQLFSMPQSDNLATFLENRL
jgi:hypothetical protein